jgi:hypothetical protein
MATEQTLQTLNKAQARVFIALAQQRQELQEAFREILDAEREQVEMLRARYGLPEGAYQIRQEPDGTLVLFLEERAGGDVMGQA